MKRLLLYFTVVVLFLGKGLHGQDLTLDQEITVQFSESPLSEVLSFISQWSGYQFSYNSQVIDPSQQITLNLEKVPLSKVLDSLSTIIHIKYKIVKGQIILKTSFADQRKIERYTISGFIRDDETGETLPGATVLADISGQGTISNSYGFYSLSLPEGKHELSFTFVGFSRQSQAITLTENLKLDLELIFDSKNLGEVTIETNEELETIQKSQMSRIKVNPKSLNTMPEFAGEVGLIKSMQSLPGIKTHSDGSAFFFVRGGNKDQNLILIDEAPVYNPAHLFGYYSVIIPDVAKDISIYKGDLPIDKGDRLSSIIDVQTKEGNLRKFELNGVLNPLIYRFSVEGPIKKDKCSFYTSFRRSNFSWIYKRAAPNSELFLYDINAKLNWKINKNNRIYYSFFYGNDNFTTTNSNETGGIRWFNFTSTLRWNHIFNSRLFSNLTFYTSRYHYALFTGGIEWNSGIDNVSLNYDLTWYPHPDYTIKAGINQTGHNFNPGNIKDSENNPFVPHVAKSQANKTVFYARAEHRPWEKFSYSFGLRLPIWNTKGPTTVYSFDTNYQVMDTLLYSGDDVIETFANLDPRISLTYQVTPSASVKFSYGIYHQYMHLISNSISPFSSFEIWLPSSANIQPQRSRQLALGFFKYFKKLNLELTSELYYKKLDHQIEYESHANLLLNPLIEGELRFGQGRAYGFEFFLRKTRGRFTGWVSYTYSRTLKQIDDLNNGAEFPAYYDRPHDISFYFSYHLSKKVNLSANWVYYTGSAFSTPIGFYQYNGYTVPQYAEKNNDRLPDYHRLDLALAWRLNKLENKYQHSLTFALYNVYNRHNPVSINFNKIEAETDTYVVPENLFGNKEILTTQKFLLGAMPSITYRFKI